MYWLEWSGIRSSQLVSLARRAQVPLPTFLRWLFRLTWGPEREGDLDFDYLAALLEAEAAREAKGREPECRTRAVR